MRRSDFLSVTGLSRDHFNKLLRDGMIPDAKSAGWGDYSPRSALLTRLALRLAKASPSQGLASKFIRAEADLIFDRFKDLATLQTEDCWIGYVRVESGEVDQETGEYVEASYKHPLCGSLGSVFQQISDLKAAAPQHDHVTDLVLIDAAQQLRDMMQRAELAGIGSNFRQELGEGSDA